MRVKDEYKEAMIREKAIEMIAKEGFDGLSMHKLAQAAGISPATIYLYFKNREDLLIQLFSKLAKEHSDAMLKDFSPDMSFEEGLKQQWMNRYRYVMQNPVYVDFMRQFESSPLIAKIHKAESQNFRTIMGEFMTNAIKKGELEPLPPETFWAIAYAPLYQLLKFHWQQRSMMNETYALNETKVMQAFKIVVRALKKS